MNSLKTNIDSPQKRAAATRKLNKAIAKVKALVEALPESAQFDIANTIFTRALAKANAKAYDILQEDAEASVVHFYSRVNRFFGGIKWQHEQAEGYLRYTQAKALQAEALKGLPEISDQLYRDDVCRNPDGTRF